MRKLAAGVVIGIAAAVVVIGADRLSSGLQSATGYQPFDTLEFKTYDWRLARTARPSEARRDLVLIEIDEYSLRNLDPVAGRWPWPRAVHSMLLDYLARAPAKLVAYDVNFAEADTRTGFTFGGGTWSGAESDKALIDSVRRSGNVLLLADATYEGAVTGTSPTPRGLAIRGDGSLLLERDAVFPPFRALADAAAGVGHNLFVLDPDGPLRHTVPFVRWQGRALPSLGLAAALRGSTSDAATSVAVVGHDLQLGDRSIPSSVRQTTDAGGVRSYLWSLIDFRGPALLEDLKSRPYTRYSFFDLLYSEEQLLAGQKPNVDPSVFKDGIVFVGVTASGLHDVFETPFSRGRMPGVQVHAAVADDLLSNRFIRRAPDPVSMAVVGGLALVAGLVSTQLPAWWAAGGVSLLGVATAMAATRLFAAGYWLNLSLPLLSQGLALFLGVAYQYFVEGREKRQVQRLFGQYVSKDVYAQLVAHPEFARLGGQRREMTVLFSDIRGFTTLTEQGQPEAVVAMLNQYFTRMVDIVFRHHGTLDKFVGDMVMALFGAPLDDASHADHAVAAALDMCTELRALNARWAADGRPTNLEIGIGINTGPMIAGNIGSDAIKSYTVIGDAVNLGSRLESLNKQYGTRILISDATRRQLHGRYDLRPLGAVVVKGKTEAVEVFEVLGRSGGGLRDQSDVSPRIGASA